MFYVDYIAGKKVVKSDLLSNLTHFFTTRENCIFSKNDDMSANRRSIEAFLGQAMATNQPVHGINIEKVRKDKTFYENTDGLLIESSGAAFLNFADCTPLILSCHDIAVVAHAGWRGTAQCMAKEAANKLIGEYGFSPREIKAVIGPAICMNCYEVGNDVYEALKKTISIPDGLLTKTAGNKFHVDLKGINKQQLLELGVKKIDVCPYCTACGEKLFFSYRHDNHTGYRHSAVVKV